MPDTVLSQRGSPYRATISLDIWAWQRNTAASILEQLAAVLEYQPTDTNGGVSVQHHLHSTELKEMRDPRVW